METFYKNMLFMMVDINGLKKINDIYGHKQGDLYIKSCGELLVRIQNSFAKTYAYRYGGDEFFIISYDKDYKEVRKILQKIEEYISTYNIVALDTKISMAIGYTYVEFGDRIDLGAIMKEVDEKMYKDKKIKKEASHV